MVHIVVVGAGQAGSSLASKLRGLGFDGRITILGREPAPPYQRPPLSKKYLMGEVPVERLFLRPQSYYDEAGIELRTDAEVTGIDRDRKMVRLGEEELAYDALVLTTGSVPRHLPAQIGGALEGVHVMRDLADADALAPHMQAGKRALVVGGGYIGLEAAAVATQAGVAVTLVEMADRILQRVAAPETSDYFRKLHSAHGVDIRENLGLERLIGTDHVTGARFSDGSEAPFDLVIVGIGIAPDDDLARAAGLEIENGIKTNAFGQTSDPYIWAAGDCASFPSPHGQIRLESVQNAIDQAELVAENILGAGKEYDPDPWFWSDQYDIKLQIAGLNTGYDRVIARAGDASVSHWYYKGTELLAVDAMNDPRAYMVGKRLIEADKSPPPELVADTDTDLKLLLKA